MRIILGCIVPLIAIFLVWSIGSPPPKAVFWDTASANVTGYSEEALETGFGMADFTYPEATTAAGEVYRIQIEAPHDGDAVKAAWPVGSAVELRLKPSGSKAFAADDPRLKLWTAVVVTGGAIVILGFFIASFFSETGGTRLFLAGVGTCFIVLPLILLRFMWGFGDPPPTSLFWPNEEVEAVSNEITSSPWAGGRLAYTAHIVVERADGAEVPLNTRGSANRVAEKFSPGSRHSVKRAPDGELYERSFKFPFLIAIFMSVIGPLAMCAGLWVIVRSVRPAS
ncbi:hypothetical protein WNY37_06285 [Henriciella sp. AS95]|uniref:hypothetical protein n=1 Tax=Henriciella sp. AS95 TaxID=3135782 RepID=UPI003175CC85